MDLPNLLNKIKHKDEPLRRFIAVEISSQSVKTAVWQVIGDETQIVTIGSLEPVDLNQNDDLIAAIDSSLGNAFTGIETEPNEVIFGLPETWVTGDNIAPNQKNTIKEVCTHLALKPIGFVVTTEALVRHLGDTFGGPPSLILLNLTQSEVVVSLVLLGKIESTQVVKRSDSIVSDVEEGLARFPQKDNLPARFLLYDSREDLDALKQELIAHDWQAKLPFLHFPKIESLGSDTTVKAVALSGGAEVARSLGLADTPLPAISDSDDNLTDPVKADDLEDISTEMGFTSIATENSPMAVTEAELSPETFATKEEVDVNSEHKISFSADQTPAETQIPLLKRVRFTPFIVSLKSFFSRIGQGIQRLFGKKNRLLILIIALAIIGLLLYFYYFLPKAEVTIFLTPKVISQDLEFSVAPSATGSATAKNLVPSSQEVYEVTGSKETPSTGTVTVGDRASGKVTIYNRTLSTKTLSKGTFIQAENLKYTLNEEVKVASASTKENADFSITLEPSKVEVGATAAQIGSQYNLPIGTKFTVANFGSDSVIGSATSAFAGGSSREVAAVSKTDQATLNATLKTELSKQIIDDLSQKSSLETKVVVIGDPKITDETYSAKVGEPTDTLKLSMTMTQNYYTFKINEIESLVNQSNLSVPQGLILVPHLTKVEVKDTQTQTDGTTTVKATVTFLYMPEIDEKEVTKNLRGRPPRFTQKYLHTLPGFIINNSEINPALPLKLNSYPIPLENFTIYIKPQSP